MKITNLSQSFMFPVANLTGDGPDTILRLEGESDEDFAKRSLDLRAKYAEATASKATDVTELQATLNPKALAEFLNLGARLPSDLVEVTLTVGTMIFDLYQVTAVQPKAPLAVALFSKRLQKMAADVQNDTFDLDDSLLKQLSAPLLDEKAWERFDLTLTTVVNDQKVFLRVNHNAAMYFPKVVEAVLAIFIPEDAPADAAK